MMILTVSSLLLAVVVLVASAFSGNSPATEKTGQLAPTSATPASATPASEPPASGTSAVTGPARRGTNRAHGWFRSHRFVLDGTNICYWHDDRSPSGAPSLTTLLGICADLNRRGADYQVFFDASTWYHLRDNGAPGEKELYQSLIASRPDRFTEVPSGTSADVAVLEEIVRTDRDGKPGVWMSQDEYRDHAGRYPFVADARRHLRGRVTKRGISFDGFDWFVPLRTAA